MRSGTLFLLALSVFGCAARAQSSEDIFLVDTRAETESVSAREFRSGDEFWQAFFDKKTGKELFRVSIGRRFDGQDLKWWRYGLVGQRDFNGDGIDDYSWYGGDDTSHAAYLFLSASGTFRQIEVYETLAAEYARRLNTDPPDLNAVDIQFAVQDPKIEAKPGSLILTATVIDQRDAPKLRTTVLHVRSDDFVEAKR